MTGSHGFTLVELSIVLVIIGLILGGVMVGRSMIRSSQVNSVASDLQSYEAATQMFIDKYRGLPGDMTNATTFWGAAVANGDGDAILDSASGAGAAGEIFGAWEQMALAGLIKGTFTGISGTGSGYSADPGINVPAGRIPSSGYTWYYVGTSSGHTQWFDGFTGNHLYVGGEAGTTVTNTPIFTPAEAYVIDTKLDDGMPGLGVVRTYNTGSHPNCTNGAAAATTTATYTTTYTGIACMLFLVPGF
jgi:prepilin-type N-terminal cleavage/methylation domain-containing protein